MNRILLFGYNGHSNFGDDLLLKLAYNKIQKKDDITIVTTNKKGVFYLKKWFKEATIIFNPSPGRLFRSYRKVLYVGGNLIFNYDKNPSSLFVTRKFFSSFKIFFLAKFLGTEFGAVSLGVGPFFSKSLEKSTLISLKYFDLLFVRDRTSLIYSKKYASKSKTDLREFSDFSIGLYEELKTYRKEIHKITTILIIVRSINIDKLNNDFIHTLIELSESQKALNRKVVWCSLQKDYDSLASKLIPKGDDFWQWDPEVHQLKDFYELFDNVDLVITSRMHGLFISGMMNIPTIGITLHEKFEVAASIFDESVITVSPNIALNNLKVKILELENNFLNTSRNNSMIKEEVRKVDIANELLSNWLN